MGTCQMILSGEVSSTSSSYSASKRSSYFQVPLSAKGIRISNLLFLVIMSFVIYNDIHRGNQKVDLQSFTLPWCSPTLLLIIQVDLTARFMLLSNQVTKNEINQRLMLVVFREWVLRDCFPYSEIFVA